MDRLEFPWSGAKDPAASEVLRPGGSGDPASGGGARARSPDWTRRILIVVVVAGLVGLGWVVGKRLVAWAALWLGRQSGYQVAFRDVVLEEPPPPWFKGGEPAFLEGVRRAAGMPESFSTLETTPSQLLAAFKEAPWVEEALQATYAPGKVRVRLVYQRPAAYVQLVGGEQYLVDAKATVLAPEDVDSERLGPMIRVLGTEIARPIDPRPGVVWKSDRAGSVGPDPSIVAAARLAGFLVQNPSSAPGLRIDRIIVSDFERRGLFMETALGVMIWWRSAPGAEAADEPDAQAKWAALTAWAASPTTEPLPDQDYITFTSKGLLQVCPHPGRPHRGLIRIGPEAPSATAPARSG